VDGHNNEHQKQHPNVGTLVRASANQHAPINHTHCRDARCVFDDNVGTGTVPLLGQKATKGHTPTGNTNLRKKHLSFAHEDRHNENGLIPLQ